VRFGHRQTDTVAKTLTKRSCGRLDARRDATLGVARRDAAPFAKMLDLFKRKIITGEVKQTVKQLLKMGGRPWLSSTVLETQLAEIAARACGLAPRRRAKERGAYSSPFGPLIGNGWLMVTLSGLET
jgi:hypothetical protein